MSDGVIRVIVADDQTIVREGVALLLDLLDGIEVVASVGDGEQAVAAAIEHRPDVALLDLRMPRLGGAEATAKLREVAPHVQVVVLTTYADDESIVSALRAGARGYLTKDASSDEIEKAVREAAAGRTALDPAVQATLVDMLASSTAPMVAGPGAAGGGPAQGPGGTLTEREIEVLRLMADGMTNREIAGKLFVTEATVKTHINNVFNKLSVNDRAAAVSWAFKSGLVAS